MMESDSLNCIWIPLLSKINLANNLNVDEFLVANPTFTSSNVLLTAGQVVNTALIAPVVK